MKQKLVIYLNHSTGLAFESVDAMSIVFSALIDGSATIVSKEYGAGFNTFSVEQPAIKLSVEQAAVYNNEEWETEKATEKNEKAKAAERLDVPDDRTASTDINDVL